MPGSILKNIMFLVHHTNETFTYQIGFALGSSLFSLASFLLLKDLVKSHFAQKPFLRRIFKNRNIFIAAWILTLGLFYTAYAVIYGAESPILAAMIVLLCGFFLIRLCKTFFSRKLYFFLSLLVVTCCLLILAGLHMPMIKFLNHFEIKIGIVRTSLLKLMQSIALLTFLTWIAVAISNKVENKLEKNKQFNKSTKLLLSKLFRVGFVTISVFFGMSLVGIDLSIITFFAGAIGVAVGFGLQNILSNIFCGIIILFDKSIRPGDVVTLEDIQSYGIVHKLNARFISIRTREGVEHLIPNEFFINKKTENWTHSDPFIRVSVSFFVALDSDIDLVEKILLNVASKTERVINQPEPNVRLYSLNSYSLEMRLRVWIADPENGFSGIKSYIYKEVLKAFKENGIQMPHPPMDIFLNKPAVSFESEMATV